MWLIWDDLGHLVWVEEILLLDDLWGELVESIPLSLELSSTFLGSGVNTKDNLLVLIGLGEGVEVLLGVVEVTIVSEPGWVWNLVVEESGRGTLTELLKSEPLDDIWLLSLTPELHWSPLSTEISHGILPCLSRVSINLPSISLLGSGPVWNFETLEDSSWSSVEGDVSYSLQEGLWMEILSIDVVHDIWLLVEFVAVEILDSNAYLIINLDLLI